MIRLLAALATFARTHRSPRRTSAKRTGGAFATPPGTYEAGG